MLLDEKTRKNLEYLLFSITLKQHTEIRKYNKKGEAGETLATCFDLTEVDDISTFIKTSTDLIIFLKCLMTTAWANKLSEKWNSTNGDYFKSWVSIDENFNTRLILSPPKFPDREEFVLTFVFENDTYFDPIQDFKNRRVTVWLTGDARDAKEFDFDRDFYDDLAFEIFPWGPQSLITVDGLRHRIEEEIEEYRK